MGERPALTTSELRSTSRVPASWNARILLGGNVVVKCRTFDVSLGGAGMFCEQPLAKGKTIRLALQVPLMGADNSSRILSSNAEVIYQILSGGEYRMGVTWRPLDAQLREALLDWLERRSA